MTSWESRLGGLAFLLSVLVLAATFGLIAARGQLRGVAASFRGVEGIGTEAVALTTLMKGNAAYGVLQLIGFGILTSLLMRSEEQTLALVSFGLWIFASISAVGRSVFDGTVTVWAGDRWEEIGIVPEVYEPLSSFVQSAFFLFAEIPWLLAAAGFGWAIVRSGAQPAWVGYTAIVWSIVWLVFPFIFSFDLPAVLVLFPIIFGIGMLSSETVQVMG